MLAELSEAKASGEIADIFAEVRRLFAVPYVSAIYRHLATTPGLLEWAWGTVAPAFRRNCTFTPREDMASACEKSITPA